MPAQAAARRLALLAACLLTGCAYATSGFEPVAGDGLVDESYARLRQSWNTGDVFHYAFALRPVAGRAALCGAVGREASGGLRGVLDARMLRAVRVMRDETLLMRGIGFFAAHEGAELSGRASACVATDLPWTQDMADPSRLRLAGPPAVAL
ncbi:MAG: hypothetical protein AAF763_12120 [Pseudomonadota bacterium]